MNQLKIGSKTFKQKDKPLIMGILNVTPDSFSDGGKFFSVEKAVEHAVLMEENGADIIDVGGESSRPGSIKIGVDEEIKRVVPVVKKLVKKIDIPISVDTYKSEVAEKCLDCGAVMINDISALRFDEKLVDVVKNFDATICLMHMLGTPENMQKKPFYDDVVGDIKYFLEERASFAVKKGVKKDKIILDPGIGFGKRTGQDIEDNCTIINHISDLKKIGYPILIGASRKQFIGNICGGKNLLPISERLEGSLAVATISMMNGADIIRVHDVLETKRCVDVFKKIC